MKKIQISISQKQYYLLRNISNKMKISISEVVGECIKYYSKNMLLNLKDRKKEKLISLAGKYRSNLGDMTKNHDKYFEL